MLKALESSKLRGLVIAGMKDSGERHKLLEDLLSSAVFGRIRYLPDKAIGQLLGRLVGVAAELVTLKGFEFWPRYPVIGGGREVEPDVVVEFEEGVVVVEAKREDGRDMHSFLQLSTQIEAVKAAFFSDGGIEKPVFLMALGGHKEANPCQLSGDPWIRITWARLYAEIADLEVSGDHFRRLKSDISMAFKLHGVRVRDPLFFGTLSAVGLGGCIEPMAASSAVKFKDMNPMQLANEKFPKWNKL